jgi:hypothetical protein
MNSIFHHLRYVRSNPSACYSYASFRRSCCDTPDRPPMKRGESPQIIGQRKAKDRFGYFLSLEVVACFTELQPPVAVVKLTMLDLVMDVVPIGRSDIQISSQFELPLWTSAQSVNRPSNEFSDEQLRAAVRSWHGVPKPHLLPVDCADALLVQVSNAASALGNDDDDIRVSSSIFSPSKNFVTLIPSLPIKHSSDMRFILAKHRKVRISVRMLPVLIAKAKIIEVHLVGQLCTNIDVIFGPSSIFFIVGTVDYVDHELTSNNSKIRNTIFTLILLTTSVLSAKRTTSVVKMACSLIPMTIRAVSDFMLGSGTGKDRGKTNFQNVSVADSWMPDRQ